MKPFVQYALIAGAVVIAGAGVTVAMIEKSSAPAGATTGTEVSNTSDSAQTGRRGRGGTGGKFFAQFDTDHDGRVTRDEFNKVVQQEFSEASGNSPFMTQDQYIAYRMKDLRKHTDQMFHRDDWDGDGKLSLAEYSTPERARFEYADSDGTGVITCGSRARDAAPRDTATTFGERSSGGTGRGSGGRGAFCKSDDLNHDGQITRAEFDQATAQEFAAVAKGGFLNPDQFYGIVAAHVRDSAVHTFTRLDKDYDDKLSRDEFAASELRYFARMDKNGDGVVTRDEVSQRRYSVNANDKPGRT